MSVADVTAAFWAYERALAADDVAALDHWFLDEPETLRADVAAVLIGHAAISEFRRSRGGVPSRVVERLHVRTIIPDCVVALAETRRTDGMRGLQTQVWVDTPDGWRIAVAHVSAHPAAERAATTPADPAATAIWRVTGDPLVPGAPGGPLSGSRVAVKDLFAVAGQRVGGGNPELLAEAAVRPEHAWAVGALLDAGADVAGIAQTDELAFSLFGTNAHYGTPPNPAAPGRIPGGSSSGPVAAVAIGQADIGLGTDTGGSIRVPASYCGLYGIRTTHGAVPVEGVQPLAPGFDTVGWLTADPATLERAGDVLLPPGQVTPVRTALLADDVTALADAEVRASFTAACRALAGRTGLTLETVPALCDGRLDEWFGAFRTVQSAQAWDSQGDWVSAHPGALGPGVSSRFAFGASVTPEQRAAAEVVIADARATLYERLDPGTVLLLPASSTPAPPVDMSLQTKEEVRAASLRLTCLASLAGLPAVVLPLLSVRGLPAGLCVAGAPGTDRSLLRFAADQREAAPSS